MQTPDQRHLPGQLPQRRYARSEDWLSVVGFGGIVVQGTAQQEANRIVARAIEQGITYVDIAPSYGDAQERLGPALEPYRSRVFLACKTVCRDAEGARADLENSLKVLRTDYFDLYQLHGITDVEKDVEAAFAPGGAMEVFTLARKEGRVRHLGFSAHSEEAAFAALERYDFDSVLFPINFAAWESGKFGPRLMEAARDRNMSVLALKAMARGRWKEADPRREQHPKLWYEPMEEPRGRELALRYTLSLPVTSALPPGEGQYFDHALEVVREGVAPLTTAERGELFAMMPEGEPIFSRA